MTYSKKSLVIGLALLGLVSLGFFTLKSQTSLFAPRIDYDVITPDYGPLVKTQEITVTYEGNDLAIGNVSASNITNVKTGQKVILYDREDYVLPLGGLVSAIDRTTAGVSIKLPKGTQTRYLSDRLDIITLQTRSSKRLPLSALQQDAAGRNYIWRAKLSNETPLEIGAIMEFSLEKLPIDIAFQDDFYFEELGYKIGTYDAVVAYPTVETNEEQDYTVFMASLDAPKEGPIQQAWIDYELHRLEKQQYEMELIAANCRAGFDTNNDITIARADAEAADQASNTPEENQTKPAATAVEAEPLSCNLPIIEDDTPDKIDPMVIFNAWTHP